MCGITGIWSFGESFSINEEKLSRFNDSQISRGPDDGGTYLDLENGLGLAHRRLSILDLSIEGKQPMSYCDNRYWITYNGEVFNFIELRKELEKDGFSFRSNSDTEIILAAYQKWGVDCLLKFNGMWAFAIWDKNLKKLFLARDRWGVKPLHYSFRRENYFVFASETYAFKFLDGFKREIDEKILTIALSNPDFIEGSGYTIFKNIHQLLPGHYLEINHLTDHIQQHKWWETKNHLVTVPQNYEAQVEMFTELFEDACRIRLRSDVSIASALSGGLDSSAVYCTLNTIAKSNLKAERAPTNWQQAFVAYFPNTPNDEKKYAQEVINYTNGKAHYVEPNYSKLLNELIDTTIRFDAIACTPIICATDVYKKMYESGHRVSLDGHGADEMLYGYKQMVFNAYQTSVLTGNSESEADLLDIYTHLFFNVQQETACQRLKDYGNQIRPTSKKKLAIRLFPGHFEKKGSVNLYNHFNKELISNSWLKTNDSIFLPPLCQSHTNNYRSGNAENDMYNLFHYTSLPINLRDFDRASMQNSIEIRMPFMDWRLVSFIFSLPITSKVGNGFTKRILRDGMKNKMPESIRTRKLKIGLTAPLPNWFNGPLKEYIKDEINSSSFLNSNIWDGNAIKSSIDLLGNTPWVDFDSCSKLWLYLNAQIIINNN